jgi:hypothetical protein
VIFWDVYEKIFDIERHQSAGETTPIERWNNTLHQRISLSIREKPYLFLKNEV